VAFVLRNEAGKLDKKSRWLLVLFFAISRSLTCECESESVRKQRLAECYLIHHPKGDFGCARERGAAGVAPFLYLTTRLQRFCLWLGVGLHCFRAMPLRFSLSSTKRRRVVHSAMVMMVPEEQIRDGADDGWAL
jgi:hypothetical protein